MKRILAWQKWQRVENNLRKQGLVVNFEYDVIMHKVYNSIDKLIPFLWCALLLKLKW